MELLLTIEPSKYTNRLFVSIPENYYWIALFVLIIVTLLLVARFGIKGGLKWACFLFFVEYVYLLFCSTVFLRRVSKVAGFNYIPFKTYYKIIIGEHFLLLQCIMNVGVFIPIGMLLGIIVKKSPYVLFIGVLLSVCIESLQLVFSKGFCEIDDVIHNTLGCIFGFFLYWIGRQCFVSP